MGINKVEFDGYFLADQSYGRGRIFCPTTAWRQDFADIMKKKDIRHLRLSRGNGWQDKDINFVAELDFLEGFDLYDWNIEDLSPILNLHNLAFLGATCSQRHPIDISAFNELQALFVDSRSKIRGWEKCHNLVELKYFGYDQIDCQKLVTLNQLKTVQIYSRKIRSLNGLENLTGLTTIDLFDCRVLEDISALTACRNLKSLIIDTCSKIKELPASLNLEQLEEVELNNSREIQSLRPLLRSKKLNKIHFISNTNILDGDIACLLELPLLTDFSCMNRKHYNMSRETFRKQLTERHSAINFKADWEAD